MMRKKPVLIFCAIAIALILSGCATTRHPVPKDLVLKAQVNGLNDVRAMMGEKGTAMQENLLESLKQESAEDFPLDPQGVKTYSVLAISGGGANGAYGAGFLKGWSKEGSRPEFKVITGVSTGAIAAPFVFLGKEYDDELENVYTTMSTKDVMKSKGPLGALFGNSLATNAPLEKTIERVATKEMLAKIAALHKKGRRLFVGTANLDAQRLVVWDMGQIAADGDTELFRRVIVASAAIPVIFPPSVFSVEADGKKYDEIHGDGGTLTQVFSTYKLLEGMAGAAKKMGVDPSKVKGKMYIIRNGYMSPKYQKVKNDLASLAARSFDTIIDAQGVGDIYRIYTFMKQRGNDFNLAYIPADFVDESKEMFDPAAMRKLFDRGYQDAMSGYKWHKAPPGMEMNSQEVGE